MAQSSEQDPFTSEIVASILTSDKWHLTRSNESHGGTPVSSHRECWQSELGLAPNWPLHRSCAPWSDLSHKVAARDALRKHSTGSGWAAFFAIQLSSQLQVRMISTPHLQNVSSEILSGSVGVFFSEVLK